VTALGARGADRGQADHRTRRPTTGPALAVGRTQGLPVGVLRQNAGGPGRARGEILEQNEGAGEASDTPHGIAPRGRYRAGGITAWEHVFAVFPGRRTERVCPGRNAEIPLNRAKFAANEVAAQRAQLPPSDDQTSSFVRTRPTTSSVNSLVVAEPARSNVRTPLATASNTLS